MEERKVAVMLPCDDIQKGMLEETADGRCELLYVPKDLEPEKRLQMLRRAEVIIGEPPLEEVLQCPGLRWIQMSWAGTDIYTMKEGFPRKVKLTNARGAFQVVIPEYIMAVLLELCRNLKGYAGNQMKGCWKPLGSEMLLSGKRALILGAGDIGTGTARRLQAFGVHVTGMRRTDRNYPDCFDRMITLEDLDSELPQADIVTGSLPNTPETRKLLDERRLRLMKKGALLVNVGRGSLIDTEALVKVLKEGHLGGAALDVTDPEPLPAGHPLWSMENVIITPHIAGLSFGGSRDTENRIIHICCQNLARYLDGRELLNQVSFETGYVSE